MTRTAADGCVVGEQIAEGLLRDLQHGLGAPTSAPA